jgi:hypothetical protein
MSSVDPDEIPGDTFDGFEVPQNLPAQGNVTPRFDFTNHAVVELVNNHGPVYDPSYGAYYPLAARG